MFSSINEKQQVLMLLLIEIILIVLMGTLTTYGPEANANLLKNHTGQYTTRLHTCMRAGARVRVHFSYSIIYC